MTIYIITYSNSFYVMSNFSKPNKASTSANKKLQTRNYIFPQIWLDENYNRHELPPTTNNEPVVVNVSVYLSSIIKIDDPTQVIRDFVLFTYT